MKEKLEVATKEYLLVDSQIKIRESIDTPLSPNKHDRLYEAMEDLVLVLVLLRRASERKKVNGAT